MIVTESIIDNTPDSTHYAIIRDDKILLRDAGGFIINSVKYLPVYEVFTSKTECEDQARKYEEQGVKFKILLVTPIELNNIAGG